MEDVPINNPVPMSAKKCAAKKSSQSAKEQRGCLAKPPMSIQPQQPCCPQGKVSGKTHNFPDMQLLTLIKVDRSIFFLQGYDHVLLTKFLEKGFSQGFPLHYQGTYKSFTSKNLVSVLSNPLTVDLKISKELEVGRLAGPFAKPPFTQFWVSPLGVVPEKVPGEFCLIHHLSYPKGSSINDRIDHEHSAVIYSTIDDAIKLIKQLGPGCFMAKTDIKSAF